LVQQAETEAQPGLYDSSMKGVIALTAFLAATSPAVAAPLALSGNGDQWITFIGISGGIDIVETYTGSNPPPLSLFDFSGGIPQQWSLSESFLGLDQAEWSGATATGYIYYLNIS